MELRSLLIGRLDSEHAAIDGVAAEGSLGSHVDKTVRALLNVANALMHLYEQSFPTLGLRGLIESDADQLLGSERADE
jgi:hypothetical protein